jgi:hypothetical protein
MVKRAAASAGVLALKAEIALDHVLNPVARGVRILALFFLLVISSDT